VIETAPEEHGISSPGERSTGKARLQPKMWRLAAALTATALCGFLFLVVPGSVEVVARAPLAPVHAGQTTSSWTRPCYRKQIFRYPEVAFCARVTGRVVGSRTLSGETHVFVSGGFHLTLVELPSGSRVPPWGSRITAVGPLLRGEYGLRELKAQVTSRQ
jgi:hypothetical protein